MSEQQSPCCTGADRELREEGLPGYKSTLTVYLVRWENSWMDGKLLAGSEAIIDWKEQGG